jgi:hypothetical protein
MSILIKVAFKTDGWLLIQAIAKVIMAMYKVEKTSV